MNGIILPEVIIYNAIESVIAYIRKDLSEHNGKDEEKKTILYRLMGENIDGKPLKFNHWDFFKQTKKIFSDKGNLSVNFGFNFEVAKFLSLHIILPSEEAAESAIGQDEGYSTEIEDDGKAQEYFSQNFHSNYQIMITSTNESEVLAVYHVLKSLLLMIIPHLEVMGLRLNKISGNDVVFRDEYMPNGTFQKVINLNFNYELKVPQLLKKEIVKGILFDGHLIEKIDDDCGKDHNHINFGYSNNYNKDEDF